MASKKDTDPHGINAARKFVADVADMTDYDLYGRPYSMLAKLRQKARKIRGKFRKGGKG